MRQPHDRLFRQTFGAPRHAAALLRTGLPALAPAFDWPTLRRRTKQFVDEGLREHVPPATVNRVRTAAAALLDEWTDRILTAPTLEAVFGDR